MKLKKGDIVKTKNSGYWDGLEDFSKNTYKIKEIFTKDNEVDFVLCERIDGVINDIPQKDLVVKALMISGKIKEPSELKRSSRPDELLGPIDQFELV